jgi:hypothetical protein
MSIEEQIKDSRKISDNSLRAYIISLKKLRALICPNQKKDQPLDDCKYLFNYNKVYGALESVEKITTRKNILTAVIVALKSQDKPKTKLITRFNVLLKDYNESYVNELKKQKKTKVQAENWLTKDQLDSVYDSLKSELKIRGLMKKDKLNDKDFNHLQEALLLKTYLIFPLRNDFADMPVVRIKDYNKMDDDEKDMYNYLVLGSNNKKTFVINQFKNRSKIMNGKTYPIPKELNQLINVWMKHNKSGWYLVKNDRKTPMVPNDITKKLNSIFKRYHNKKISTSMIRHILISEMKKDEPTIIEREEKYNKFNKVIENRFLHSNATSDLHYRKVD